MGEITRVPDPAPALAETSPSPPTERLSLLLVEDNDDTRRLMRIRLLQSGYEVECAKSGEEALQALRRRLPDILLCDIGLPGMDGYEFMQQARRIPGMERVIAFATTGFGLDEDVKRARAVGYSQHLLKPVEPAELENWVRVLRRRRAQ